MINFIHQRNVIIQDLELIKMIGQQVVKDSPEEQNPLDKNGKSYHLALDQMS